MAWFFIAGDDRDGLALFLRLVSASPFQDLDLPVNAENLGHLLLEFAITALQIVTHLVRLDFLLTEDLAHRALSQTGKAIMTCRRSMLVRMAGQQPRRPQFVRIAVLLGFVARQRYQPGFGLGCDRRLFARPRSVIKGRQRAIGHRPLDTTLDRLMMDTQVLSDPAKRRVLPIGEQHLCPRYPARSSTAKEPQAFQ